MQSFYLLWSIFIVWYRSSYEYSRSSSSLLLASSFLTRWQCGNMKCGSPPLQSKSGSACRTVPVIYGVMDIDWHYYLLIASHSGSSPFEDQSGRVPLVCTDADKPRVNFNKANCSLCTSVAPKTLPALLAEMLWDQPSHLLLQDFMSCARSESTQDISEWFQLAVLFFFFF